MPCGTCYKITRNIALLIRAVIQAYRIDFWCIFGRGEAVNYMANMQYDLLELRSVVLPRSVDDSSPHSSISIAISSTDFSPVSAFKL